MQTAWHELCLQEPLPLSGWRRHSSSCQVKTAYQLLDNFHNGSVEGQPSVTTLVAEAEVLRKQQDLFELYAADYIVLQRCTVRRKLVVAATGRRDSTGKESFGGPKNSPTGRPPARPYCNWSVW